MTATITYTEGLTLPARAHPTMSALALGRLTMSRATLTGMSVVSPSEEPTGLTVLPPEQALERALPAPTDAELVIDGLTDAEWEAFSEALAER